MHFVTDISQSCLQPSSDSTQTLTRPDEVCRREWTKLKLHFPPRFTNQPNLNSLCFKSSTRLQSRDLKKPSSSGCWWGWGWGWAWRHTYTHKRLHDVRTVLCQQNLYVTCWVQTLKQRDCSTLKDKDMRETHEYSQAQH